MAPSPSPPARLLQRICFWTLLGGFGAATLWWITWFPYDPARLYRALPPNATFVSEHDQPAARWLTLLRAPTGRRALLAAGVSSNALDRLAANPRVETWSARLAARKVVLGCVPARRAGGAPLWVASSWVGARGKWLEWLLNTGRVKGVTLLQPRPPYRAWLVDTLTDRRTGARLVVTLWQGQLVACYSDNPLDIRLALHRIEMAAPPPPCLQARLAETPAQPGAAPADRAWLAWESADGTREHVAIACSRLTPLAADGYIASTWPRLPATAPAALDEALQEVRQTLHTPPSAAAALPLTHLDPLFAPTNRWIGLRLAGDLLRAVAARDTCAVAVFGGAASGSLLSLRVPAVVLGVPIVPGAAVTNRLQAVLDVWNARQPLGLIACAVPDAEPPVLRIDAAVDGAYANLAPDEKLAVAVRGDWLWVGSHAGALRRLLAPAPQPDAGAREAVPPPAPSAADPAASGRLGLDVPAFSQDLRNALAVTDLALRLGGPPSSAGPPAGIEATRVWLTRLAPLRTAAATWRANESGVTATFELTGE